MTLRELLEYGSKELHGVSDTPQLDSQILLCDVTNYDKVYMILNPSEEIDENLLMKFKDYIARRKESEPVQYIINSQEFMGFDFYVDSNVLIPRADTEILVEEILKSAKKGSRILDIGTGSGAITISLAKLVEESLVDSVDISDSAIQVAKRNSINLGVAERTKFINIDIFDEDVLSRLDVYDIVVSNPPYIPKAEMDELKSNVIDYEPYNALYGGVDGLDFYWRIVDLTAEILKKDGIMAFECGYNQGEDIKKIMEDSGFFDKIDIVKDLSGLDRVVIGYRPTTVE
ncbi:MAG: peptide chain release factor N(5)-glutamine methyltransferase [Firmicutes bacterium]|jgi:release factor glutamine methyltransferase|nr:peptide chain release factor N(5)-glutamine methyltransferase [Bacillota bacterium]